MTLGNYPIFLPIGGGQVPLAAGQNESPLVDGPEGTLLGRPVYKSQHAAAFSSKGDILLIAPYWYRTITKAEAMEAATSMHLYFDAGATAYRVTFRVDGQPKISAPVAQAKGSNTLSPFVQLAARP
jgi:HK97 family phage major capsid protein